MDIVREHLRNPAYRRPRAGEGGGRGAVAGCFAGAPTHEVLISAALLAGSGPSSGEVGQPGTRPLRRVNSAARSRSLRIAAASSPLKSRRSFASQPSCG